MSLWESLKKGLLDGLQTASDKSSEFTRIGRLKIDLLGVQKELEEKFIELGGRLYHGLAQDTDFEYKKDINIIHLIEQIRKLEDELNEYRSELKRIKNEDGIDLD